MSILAHTDLLIHDPTKPIVLDTPLIHHDNTVPIKTYRHYFASLPPL